MSALVQVHQWEVVVWGLGAGIAIGRALYDFLSLIGGAR